MAQEFLISILPRRGPEAFGKFIASLMNCPQQQFIAEDLDPQLARRFRDLAASEEADVDTTDAAIIQEVAGSTGTSTSSLALLKFNLSVDLHICASHACMISH